MKYAQLALLSVFLALPIGCATASSPTPPLAPGYSNSQDQTLGQTLAAINAFVTTEKSHFNTLTTAQQSKERTILNPLIDATTVANAVYLAYHAGTKTEADAQTAVSAAQAAQTNFSSQNGVK